MTERCFLAHPDVISFHEPMGDPFYWGPERASMRFSPEQCQREYKAFADVTFSSMWEKITNPDSANKICFSKDMAKFLFKPKKAAPSTPIALHSQDGNPTLIPTNDLLKPGVVHAFLIRNPKEAVPSWYKLALSPETGFDYFDPEELGIHELRTLYDFVASNSSVQPLLIDSQDMIKNSHKVLALLCSRAGISFKDEMLDWESSASQAKELFSKYPGWHVDAERSTSILQRAAKDQEEMPPEVMDAIEDNMEDYLYLKEKAHNF